MKKRVSSIFIFLAMVCSMLIPAAAAETENTNGYNVIIAMDSSGSLQYTDPNNYRYNAVNLFIQLLANKNNKLGCLSFADDVSNQKELASINQSSDKQSIYDALTSTKVDGWTNIGSALQAAVTDIKSNSDKDQPSVILLFSDGNTEMPTEKELKTSLDAKADAVQAARDNNIAIYSICLNADGKADRKEMEQVSKATGGKFVEIKKAEDLQDALTTFYSMIYGTSVKTIVDNTFDSKGSVVVPFDVPGTGVGEINVIIYGKAKDIVITKPDNTKAECDVIKAETFSFLKVSDVIPGRWMVTLSGVPGDKVKIDLLFNTDLSVLTNIEPNQDSFNPEDEITFEAILNSEKKNTDSSDAANGFVATLQFRDVYGEVVKEIPMTEKDGRFLTETQLKEGVYKYSVKVQGYNITKESAIKGPITISNEIDSQAKLANKAPTPVSDPVEIKLNLWPFKDNHHTINVTELATDDQEEPLEYRIESSSYIEGDDYTFDGQTLEMTDYSLSKGEFLINAYDMYGESCQITVHVTIRNIGLITVITIGIIALLVLIALIVVAKVLSGKPFMGEITVTNLKGYQSATQRKNRGSIKISAFLVGNTGINGKSYFQATGKDYIYFVSKDQVESDTVVGKTKKIKIENNFDTRIYADSSHENGIEVRFNSFKN